MTTILNLNERALALVDRLTADREAYGISVNRLENGVRWLDMGIRAPGSLEAGRLFAEVSLGGLGTVSFAPVTVGGRTLPGLCARTDHPAVACLASQAGGRTLRQPDYDVILSGPGRALAAAQDAISVALGYGERAQAAVLCVEGREPPSAGIAARLAATLGIAPEALTLLIAPTASLVGSVQVAARIIEVPLLKLHNLGFDTRQVLHGWGTCPLPPVAADDLHAMGVTNDAIMYGGQTHFIVRGDDGVLAEYLPRVPASAGANYGAPFYDLMRAVNFQFYELDPLIFGPAQAAFNNIISGRTMQAGQVAPEVLWRSFGLEGE
ncbi:MAG: methenyltetrahydromethanopterin cyclohydrolase [Anaerolineales bacterium]|nr:methenyltetrahydromethanopterin cyclohydrolase [Anaerolineales bacterium]